MTSTESTLTVGDRVWHGAYCRWYDHREAGHTGRAKAWGWIADQLVRLT